MDDVEFLRWMILNGKNDRQVMAIKGWGSYRIDRIRKRAIKDGREIPEAGRTEAKNGLNEKAE